VKKRARPKPPQRSHSKARAVSAKKPVEAQLLSAAAERWRIKREAKPMDLPAAAKLDLSPGERILRAYLYQLQRDEAYRALRDSQRQLLEKNIELERLTNVDGLTGISNRRFLDESMEVQWRQAIRDKTSFAVLMIDIDDFKRYNDTHGHVAGDEVLKSIARSIQHACARPVDLAARFGGEEFIVCLPFTPLEGAALVAEKIRSTVEQQHPAHNSGVNTTVSVGCAAVIPQKGDSFKSLIETADQALYQAKRQGKNRVVTKLHQRNLVTKQPSRPKQ
jgi:two-component system chemotaxis family response regulator WspR